MSAGGVGSDAQGGGKVRVGVRAGASTAVGAEGAGGAVVAGGWQEASASISAMRETADRRTALPPAGSGGREAILHPPERFGQLQGGPALQNAAVRLVANLD